MGLVWANCADSLDDNTYPSEFDILSEAEFGKLVASVADLTTFHNVHMIVWPVGRFSINIPNETQFPAESETQRSAQREGEYDDSVLYVMYPPPEIALFNPVNTCVNFERLDTVGEGDAVLLVDEADDDDANEDAFVLAQLFFGTAFAGPH